jgi:cell division septal protein FtsQ
LKPVIFSRGKRTRKSVRKRNSRNRRRSASFAERTKGLMLKSLKVAGAMLVVPVLLFSGAKFYNLLITTEYLEVRTIEVVGIRRVSRGEVVALSGIREGENIFSFKYSDALDALKSHPWAASAALRRIPPHTVRIELKEKEPVALVKSGDMYVMDWSGMLFAKYSPVGSADLPVVTGPLPGAPGAPGSNDPLGASVDRSVLELMDVLDGREGFGIRNVSEINVDPIHGLAIYTLAEGVRLELGHGLFEGKLRAFERVVRARGGTLGGIEAMNLKSGSEVVVRFVRDVVEGGGAT